MSSSPTHNAYVVINPKKGSDRKATWLRCRLAPQERWRVRSRDPGRHQHFRRITCREPQGYHYAGWWAGSAAPPTDALAGCTGRADGWPSARVRSGLRRPNPAPTKA
jgi:hypothetical protein